MKCASALCLLVVFLCSTVFSRAQSPDGTISGVVVDPSGRVISDASVEILNDATGVHYFAKTNETGTYTVTVLPPGQYRLQVSKPGFKTLIKPGIILNVESALALNFTMPVGATSESITVEAGESPINTTDGSVSTVIDRRFVENIPLNGRSLQDLISMTPGIVTASPQSGGGIGVNGDFSVNGQRTESNYYTVDGVSANLAAGVGNGGQSEASGGTVPGGTAFGTTQSLLSVDALQEFRVESSTYSATYGRSPGGQFSLVSRSGGNDVHWNAFEYFRNNYFDANDWFNDHYGVPIAALRQNDFGGTLGGPVSIPKIYNGSGRSFFFASYEGLRLSQPQAAMVEYVPDSYMRQQAPPAIATLLNAFPQPNGTDYGTAADPSLAQFIKSYALPGQIDSTSVRLDQTFSPKLTLFFRFGDTPSSISSRYLSAVGAQRINTSTYTFGTTSDLDNRLDNEFRIGYARTDAAVKQSLDAFGSAVPTSLTSEMGLGAYPTAASQFELYYSGIGASYLSGNGSAGSANEGRQWNITDTLTFSSGRNVVKFGADYRRVRTPSIPSTPSAFAYFFSTNSVLNDSADYLLLNKWAGAEPIVNETAVFVQDEWHCSRHLNVSLGLRWEVNPPPTGAHGNDAYTLLGNLSSPASLQLAPRGTPLWKTTWFNFAPRLGMAWTAHSTPGRETVVRGGAGVFLDANNQTATYGFEGLGFVANEEFFNSPLPVTSSQFGFSTAASPPYTSGTVYAFPPHLQAPYTLQWNVSLEQALGKVQSLNLSYVGANGRRLMQVQEFSVGSLNPEFSYVSLFPGGVTSSYNALQVRFQRRMARGLQALASYTWSHSLDLGSLYLALPLTRGNSDLDVRNNFSGALSWNLPGVKTASVGSFFVNGWSLDAHVMARSAFPVTLQGAFLTDPATGQSYYGNVNLVPNQPFYLHGNEFPGGRSLNPAAFTTPTSPDVGDAPRNFLRGFDATQENVAIRRDFELREGLRLEFRAETFNLLNHPNFGSIDTGLFNATFGQALSMLNQSLGTMASQYQQGGPRSMQFALKLVY